MEEEHHHRGEGGAPKVTVEKMERFVEAMTDLVKVTLHLRKMDMWDMWDFFRGAVCFTN